MKKEPYWLKLSCRGVKTLLIKTGGEVFPMKDLKGYWDAPSSKVSLTERESASGAHNIRDGEVLYSARTVTISFGIKSYLGRDRLEQIRRQIGSFLGHRDVRLTVHDGTTETYVTGYVENGYSGLTNSYMDDGTITLTCPDPRRMNTTQEGITLWATTYKGGLKFPLTWPLKFKDPVAGKSRDVVYNKGNWRAYPTISINGKFDTGLRIYWHSSDGHSDSFVLNTAHYNAQSPITIDTYTASAKRGSVEVSRWFSKRSYPTVPALGDMTWSITGSGTGWVNVQLRDTNI